MLGKAILVAALGAVLFVTAIDAQAKDVKVGVVVKIGGIPWFNAMETGIKEKSKELGDDGFMVGPTSADPALQVRAIEDLIAQGVNAIGVVPNDANVLEPVLKKARDAGITVITHESPDQVNADWDFEMVSAVGFGEAHAKLFADKMGGKGKYVVYVGSLTVPAHNAWADAAIAYIKKNYPDMHMVGDRYGVAESADDSRKTALDVLAANPDLGGFLTFGSQGPIGVGRALDEQKLGDKVVLVGSFSPSQGSAMLKSGTIDGGFMWNPLEAGKVFVTLSDYLVGGGKVTDGMTIEGLGVVHPDFKTGTIIVDANQPITVDTVDGLAALGL
ncbi:substrate-binding domain-containing protein [Mesorhizobium australicum]|uniref:substrate-binding domain-containing protein n=1 Tax=Mesorhizobium australicum TaxID=536018 RepID=UPI0033357044